MKQGAASTGTLPRFAVWPGLSDPTALCIWLVACTIAVFFALILVDSAIIDGLHIPRTNDSLYHARRILDAAVGPRGFYEFDERLQVPEGTWVPWPWAYDYLLSRVAAFGVWLYPASNPLAVVFYVPVVWLLVNAALFLAICRAIRLSTPMQALAMLCFALSPLTQLLHAVGMLDHHYVEHTFVLLCVWLGIRWFENLESRGRAVALGTVLGFAPAFHNGLFILQLLPLGALFILWLRHAVLARAGLQSFAIALLVATQLVLLPSEPYRRGMFEFGLLSWFHFYVATGTAVIVVFFARSQCSPRRLVVLGALGVAMLAPLAPQLLGAAGFLSGSFSILDQIIEVQSPYTLFTSMFGPMATASFYSWLLIAAPPLALFMAYRVARETVAERLYFSLAAVLGLLLLLTQFRLHYFGWFALVTAPLLLVDDLRKRLRWHAGATFAAAFGAVVLAFQPALRERLFLFYAPGSAPDYASVLPLYLELAPLCAAEPGVVLAHSDDGSAVLFHTECSVIANNFILTPSDEKHLNEVWRLLQLPPQEILQQRADIKYLLLRARDFLDLVGNQFQLSPSNAVAQQLLTAAPPPPGFELLKTVMLQTGPTEGDSAIFARLYRVRAPEAAIPVSNDASSRVSASKSHAAEASLP
jgi:hypothetical protein